MRRNGAVSALKRIAQVLSLWVVLEVGYIVAVVGYDVTVFGWLDLRKATLHKALLVPSSQAVLLILIVLCYFLYRTLRKKT